LIRPGGIFRETDYSLRRIFADRPVGFVPMINTERERESVAMGENSSQHQL
jgi:hypothetical protein